MEKIKIGRESIRFGTTVKTRFITVIISTVVTMNATGGQYVSITIDKFGRHCEPIVGAILPPSLPFDTTGNYDVEKKRLINLEEPVNTSDGATKQYTDNKFTNFADTLHSYIIHPPSSPQLKLLQKLINQIDNMKASLETKKKEFNQRLTELPETIERNIEDTRKELQKLEPDLQKIRSLLSKFDALVEKMQAVLQGEGEIKALRDKILDLLTKTTHTTASHTST